MIILYHTGICIYILLARLLAASGNHKARLFIEGRKGLLSGIRERMTADLREKVWFHVSSLGEFEQAKPLIERFREAFPSYSVVLTFFSPSGYELRKNDAVADHICYLPFDTKNNAREFIRAVRPKAAFFAKYDLWYHYLHELNKRNIPSFLFSAVFQERQAFFRWYGSLHRKMLRFFTHFFVQDTHSLELLSRLGYSNVTVTGDTRIDRVQMIVNNIKSIPKVVCFKNSKKLLVVGSAWKDDWQLVLKAFHALKDTYQLLIAPHETSRDTILEIKRDAAGLSTALYSGQQIPEESNLLIIDNIGMLSSIYQYADVVWIGGGFRKSGIHNILEPAVFGLPVFTGPHYHKFNEANTLVQNEGMIATTDADILLRAVRDESLLAAMREKTATYIKQNSGAVDEIMNYFFLEKKLFTTL